MVGGNGWGPDNEFYTSKDNNKKRYARQNSSEKRDSYSVHAKSHSLMKVSSSDRESASAVSGHLSHSSHAWSAKVSVT